MSVYPNYFIMLSGLLMVLSDWDWSDQSSQGQQCAIKLHDKCSYNPSSHLSSYLDSGSPLLSSWWHLSICLYSKCLVQGMNNITFTSFTGSSPADSWCPAPDRKPSWFTLISNDQFVAMWTAIVSSVYWYVLLVVKEVGSDSEVENTLLTFLLF